MASEASSGCAAGDLTSWLAHVHVLAGAPALLGNHADAARLFAAVPAHGARIGFNPEAMNPAKPKRNIEAARQGLTDGVFATHLADGTALDNEQVMALAARVAHADPLRHTRSTHRTDHKLPWHEAATNPPASRQTTQPAPTNLSVRFPQHRLDTQIRRISSAVPA